MGLEGDFNLDNCAEALGAGVCTDCPSTSMRDKIPSFCGGQNKPHLDAHLK